MKAIRLRINAGAGSRRSSRRLAAFLVAVFGAIVLPACVSIEEIAPPVSAAAGYSPTVIEGRSLYVRRCGQCHPVTPVADYTWSEWQPIMDEMAVESKFSPEQKAAVLAYVRTHCAR